MTNLCGARGALVAVAASIFALASSGTQFAQGATIVDSGGFESYTLGQLEGQHGWLAAGSGAGSATVETSVVATGSKAVALQKGANVDRRWAVPVTGQPSGRFIVIDWDMRVTGTGAEAGIFGPFFGVEANDDADTQAVSVLGNFGVDSTTGDVLYQSPADGILIETGTKAAFDTWNSYRMVLDFQTHQYTGFFNGVQLVSSGFVDNVSQQLDHFTDADIAALAAAPDAASMSQAGTAYFDNFKVSGGLEADFNYDNKVDGSDLAAWKSSFGPNAGGDANLDGRTDGADFLIWQQQQGSNAAGASGAVSAVPEPHAAVLAFVAAAGVAARRRASRTAA
jgi:hypothetical protein